MSSRLAVITTHPIQYNAPWFRHLSRERGLDLRVFYLWDFGIAPRRDPRFGHVIQWDVPLLEGYDSEMVPNASWRPGTHHLAGLWNPSLPRRVRAFDPTHVLLLTYNYAAIYDFLARWGNTRAPLLFRGDSHRLVRPAGLGAVVRRRLIERIFRRFSAFLYVGQANRRYFTEHHVPDARLFFAPHAVDNDRFIDGDGTARRDAQLWRTELGIPRAHRVVLFAGKFEPKKRPLDLLHAFRRAAVPETSLLFVGAGELDSALRSAAGADPRIHFAPFQNQTAMPRTYAAGDLFILPSFGPGETWGLAVNEAMCVERPVVVSSHVGCAEDLVEHGRNGLTFPAGDVDALARTLQVALSDDARLRAWGRAARDRVTRYSYAAAADGLCEAMAALDHRRALVRPTASLASRDA